VLGKLLTLLRDDFLQTIKSAFQFSTIARPQAGLFALFVLAFVIIACTPTTYRLDTVAANFASLTCFATVTLWHQELRL
jgi:hypothetical protein